MISRYHLGSLELSRLWAFWLGMPVPPRQWTLRAPQDPHQISDPKPNPHQGEL